MIRDLARRVVQQPDDASRWRALARALPIDDALALVDEAADALGRDPARALLTELTGVPWHRLGRPFARYPDVDALPAHLHADDFHLRPVPSPAGDRWLVATGRGWCSVDTGALAPREQLTAIARGPACWLSNDAVALADADLLSLNPDQGPPHTHTLDHPIASLLGPIVASDAVSRLAVATSRDGLRDVLLLDPHGARTALANISAALAIEAAPLQGTGFVCTGDGVQSSEVREVRVDGGWRTRMVHTAPLRGVTAVDAGRRAVTVDRAGRVVVWEGAGGRARPVDSGVVGESFGALVRRPVQCGFVEARRELLVVHEDRRGLVFARLDDESTAFVDGLLWLPSALPSSSGVAPVGGEDGWLWVDLETRQMPDALRAPAALATDDELQALPGVTRRDVEALRRGDAVAAHIALRVRGVRRGRLAALAG